MFNEQGSPLYIGWNSINESGMQDDRMSDATAISDQAMTGTAKEIKRVTFQILKVIKYDQTKSCCIINIVSHCSTYHSSATHGNVLYSSTLDS